MSEWYNVSLSNSIILFLVWTLVLYWIHRLAHISKTIMKFHGDHHRYVNLHGTSWRWNNLLLFNDNWKSTIDLWITEVIPTILFSLIFNAWWIFIFYWIWAALIQEIVEHHPRINIPLWSSGQWHLQHHKNPTVNFSLFFTIWDRIFKTNSSVQ